MFNLSLLMLYSYTNGIVTLWYRPSELRIWERNNGPAIDRYLHGEQAEFWTRYPTI